MVMSVEKAFRVLSAFGRQHQTLNLSQVASETGMDLSAAQRFTHTLTKLGYLRKDRETKRFELTAKTLDLGYHFFRSSRLVDRAMPYLMHLSKETEETVNLTVLRGHGDHLRLALPQPARAEHGRHHRHANAGLLHRSWHRDAVAPPRGRGDGDHRRVPIGRPHTPSTTWQREGLARRSRSRAAQGYATAFEEFYLGDASIAAPILDHRGRPEGAVNIAVSCSRYSREEVVDALFLPDHRHGARDLAGLSRRAAHP